MSMTTLVILRFLGIFAVYTGVTLALPALMFRRILRGRSLAEQFLMCYTFGNFYIINIVFLLQLLHISNFFTLAGLTAVLSIVIGGSQSDSFKAAGGKYLASVWKTSERKNEIKISNFSFPWKMCRGNKKTGEIFLSSYCEKSDPEYASAGNRSVSVLDLRKTDYLSLWLSCIRYPGAYELDQ